MNAIINAQRAGHELADEHLQHFRNDVRAHDAPIAFGRAHGRYDVAKSTLGYDEFNAYKDRMTEHGFDFARTTHIPAQHHDV